MAKLYTVKEMADLLNKEFGSNPANYEFTEERVRARLRSARARGTITPRYMGYDRRTNYYSEEDFAKLKASWIGPELPEFTEHPEDREVIDTTKEEVTVRPAKPADAEAIFDLIPAFGSASQAQSMRNYVAKMLKSRDVVNFVSTLNDDAVTGWAQAEISAAVSVLQGAITGIIRVFVPNDRNDRVIAMRSLMYRTERWLRRFDVNRILVEIAESMADLRGTLTDQMSYQEKQAFLYCKEMSTTRQEADV